MARKTSKRRRGGVKAIRVDATTTLGALASGVFITGILIPTVEQEHFAISMDISVTMGDHTVAQGPLAVGVAHGDYTVAEISEWFNSTGVMAGDQIALERSRRKIRDICALDGEATTEKAFDGSVKRIPLRFKVEDGESVNIWAMNQDDDPLTTGTFIRVYGKYFYRPM